MDKTTVLTVTHIFGSKAPLHMQFCEDRAVKEKCFGHLHTHKHLLAYVNFFKFERPVRFVHQVPDCTHPPRISTVLFTFRQKKKRFAQ